VALRLDQIAVGVNVSRAIPDARSLAPHAADRLNEIDAAPAISAA
jgi:hypothetical protein